MAIIPSLEENLETLKLLRSETLKIIERVQSAADQEKDLLTEGVSSPSYLKDVIEGLLAGIRQWIITDLSGEATALSNVIDIWGVIVRQDFAEDPRAWRSTKIDVDVGETTSVITANQDNTTNIFVSFDVADKVKISNAEDPRHNGVYTVSARTAQTLTFNTTMRGEDNLTDKSIIFTLVER